MFQQGLLVAYTAKCAARDSTSIQATGPRVSSRLTRVRTSPAWSTKPMCSQEYPVSAGFFFCFDETLDGLPLALLLAPYRCFGMIMDDPSRSSWVEHGARAFDDVSRLRTMIEIRRTRFYPCSIFNIFQSWP